MQMRFLSFLFTVFLLTPSFSAFQSDELLVDDEEFGLEGAPPHPHQRSSDPAHIKSPPTPTTTRRKFSDSDSDSKIQFSLEHAFGDSDFVPAGTFSARLKTWSHGGQTLTKLRFSRNEFAQVDKEKFERCLPREGLDEHFVIHMEGVNILGVNYGAPGACPYPRQMKLPAKWSFNSHTVLKNSEQAPRTPVFSEEQLGENGEGEAVTPPERSFWAKYWMYLIPLGLIVMNAITQAMNLPEEQAAGQAGAQPGAVQRGPSPAVRRR
ncbi:hypothetical protein MANES_13G003500v8 [Manihot esculenta]|uniref:ER membrane protein complex subunit 10 n=1 Tax=Manihot esculenta TaxID=3983 RepID=A0A2C9UNP9_MANES|nr:hypothetical protein MANES_13G003500v8 [Manihot esculenta]